MTVNSLIRELGLIAAAGRKKTMLRDTDGCYVGDILTNALAEAKKGDAWITSVIGENAAAVALSTGVSCIILAGGKRPDGRLIRACRKYDVPLLLSEHGAYQTACMVYEVHRKSKFDKKYKRGADCAAINIYISGSLLCRQK